MTCCCLNQCEQVSFEKKKGEKEVTELLAVHRTPALYMKCSLYCHADETAIYGCLIPVRVKWLLRMRTVATLRVCCNTCPSCFKSFRGLVKALFCFAFK